MTGADVELRNRTYARLVELGRPPLARELGLPVEDVRAAWARLHDAHALVLDASGEEILLANPFSAVSTPHRVEAGGRSWYGSCALDAFGICSALHVDGRVESACADCGSPIAVDVREGRPSDESPVFHCLVPAAHWWDDIVFT